MSETARPVRIPDFADKKRKGERIAVLTAYDATMARLIDRGGVDAILVGDSLGTVIMGCDTTLEVTMDIMVHHTRAVAKGVKHAAIIADLPFASYQASVSDAVKNSARLLAEGHAAAVKLEGGRAMVETVARLVDVGIPVMGHLGLTPQSIHKLGGNKKIPASESDRLMEDAKALEKAGAFSIVLEMIPTETAKAITAAIGIPTIGIGAGPHCDGQVLVSYDAFGLFDEFVPSFVKQYARMGEEMARAAAEYTAEVRDGRFPK
jgi:3-methyl-2-oxobutanoate hydroxymethyltransferase